ncbi:MULTISPECIES: bifunctional hydroxymethylpyrimidine kinase/phosphomethylpyrimidine kinase [unclassified Oleiphilus]|nr:MULTISPECIES: bifunctional hydroxymethylpyrimidine kinase/phosphomethylpyrimidine kinase [unclassified Oleiphilus]KZY79111.1 hypothetical protein A3740_07200 [Oleiphilus sp. HI0068]KZY88466.1 hypothetical protein A3741_00010 [Oleiphilus sp. HI0069]KZY93969.1 hypothetical protein A3743_06035 [Oleiphilus sp. HI0072]KZZ06441.1 hypothetical protein A3749_17045 [Oleiphilus sp. HI0078]KZZ20240.1 hypothetical protein A3752_12265 [Oleiphilus sp. HI0081]
MKYTPNVLTIAGSDSSGGAGIQADIKTFTALNVYGASVITNVTAQNSKGVKATYPLPAKVVKDQLQTVISDINFKAIKIGMLYSSEIINEVVECLSNNTSTPIVIDPVLTSSSGVMLLEEAARTALVENLFPLATLITPNLMEANYLLQFKGKDTENLCTQNKALLLSELFACSVLLKGGHVNGEIVTDYLQTNKAMNSFSHKRIATNNTHGTGCTLSSAIAANLAKQPDLFIAVKEGISFTESCIQNADGLQVGNGYGPINQLPFSQY